MKPYSNGRMGQGQDWAQDSMRMAPVTPEPERQDGRISRELPPRPERRSGRLQLQPQEEQSLLPQQEQGSQVLSTNRTIRLSCTLAAMLSPFALFLLKAQHSSRAIRHHSVQSTALGLIHVILALVCLTVGMTLGHVPVLGVAVSLLCWLGYGTVLAAVTILRLRLMLHAWRGLRYDLPLLGWWLERFV